jgi:ADP-heptose:LPS heptosyltransferase
MLILSGCAKLRFVKRYRGQVLPPQARIALISNDALGNYVVLTPLIVMLKDRWPRSTLHYFGGVRTQELWENEPLIDHGFPLFGTHPASAITWRPQLPYDWIINVESTSWAKSFAAILADLETWVSGPILGPEGRSDFDHSDDSVGDLWRDPDWTSQTLCTRFPQLQSGFIGEIFCRGVYLSGPIPHYRVPVGFVEEPIPDLLIATAASLPEKLWPEENWSLAVREIVQHGYTVGIVGASPTPRPTYWKGSQTEEWLVAEGLVRDFRGAWTLPEVVGALGSAKAVLTLDNGILHLAAATSTPIVGLFRTGIHRLWAPPVERMTALTPRPGQTVADVSVADVVEATLGFLRA